MDPKLPASEVSEEKARQSLIQISQTSPVQALNSKLPHSDLIGSNAVENRDAQKIEEYRLQLMSISDIENPDVIANVPSQLETGAS